MVFHVSNYMRETNVWMIRKCRWFFWGVAFSVPIYRNTYWDYLGRRVAWVDYFFRGSEEDKKAAALAARADWGYHPRYEPVYSFSIKTAKHAQQTPLEKLHDIPRMHTKPSKAGEDGRVEPKLIRNMVNILDEHNRQPGVFDYDVPQNFYSHFAEIEHEAYVTVGGKGMRRVHQNEHATPPAM